MQVLKEEVRKSIRNAAIKSFKEQGYQKASMRTIAKEAGMSVGNLYRYYNNKETLFGALVQPMIDFFERGRGQRPQKLKLEMLDVNLLEHSTFLEQLMAVRMDFKDELYILFLCAEGSPYEGAKEALRTFLEETAVAFLDENNLVWKGVERERAFIKVLAASVTEGFCVNLQVSASEKDFLMTMLRFMELVVKPAIRNLIALRDNKTSFRRISDEEIIQYFSHHHRHCHHRRAENHGEG